MMNFVQSIALASLILCTLPLAGCERDISAGTYTGSSVGESMTTQIGVVIASKVVQVKEGEFLEDNTTGLVVGGVGGALAGSAFGKGSGKTAATIGGALLGATAGTLAEKNLKSQQALQYTVKIDGTSGYITIVQGIEPQIRVGTKVFVHTSRKGRSRIEAM